MNSLKKRVFACMLACAMLVPMASTAFAQQLGTPSSDVAANPAPVVDEVDAPRPGQASTEDGVALQQYTTKRSVSVYAAPGSKVILSLKSGDVVLAKGAAKDGWQAIILKDGTTAYVKTTDLNMTQAIVLPEGATITEVKTSANIRIGRNSTSKKVAVARKGTTIGVIRFVGKYAEVRVMTKSGIQTGWMLTKFLDL